LRLRFEKSRAQSDIRTKGGNGYVLHADVRIWLKNDVWNDGKYLFVWTPDGKWKEELVLPNYRRKRSGNGSQFWQVRSTDAEDPKVAELDRLIRLRPPKPGDDEKLEKVQVKGEAGKAVECIRITRQPGGRPTYCFDAISNDLIEVKSGQVNQDVRWKADVQSQSDFREWSGKRVPFLLRAYNGDRPVLIAQVQDIKPVPELPPDFFESPAGASVWAECSEGLWKLKNRISPDYPRSARMARRQGTVIIRAIINEDGQLSDVSAVESPYPELTQPALSAVSQWRYEKISACQDSKGRSETFIDVRYSLNP
jgi:TonB family protein